MNSSERYVSRICNRSFLSLWCYPNPRRKDGKELCDILVVSDPDIIIISVKEIGFKETENNSVAHERWRKKAITKSVGQIFGAEKWIENAQQIITKDGSYALPFPPPERRVIHRIAVAFGGCGKTSIEYGDFGHGFVHVFDEESLNILMSELDTISDFIQYLRDKETLISSVNKIVLEGGEEDLLTYYLANNRSFPQAYDCIIITNDMWKVFSRSEKYQNKKRDERISYAWDALIEQLISYYHTGELLTEPSLNNFELSIRVLSKESRFGRRVLSEVFANFLQISANGEICRVFSAHSGVTYVFLATADGISRENRQAELHMRCILARGLRKDSEIVVGIATECYRENAEVSYDLLYYHLEKWDEKAQETFDMIQNETGYFKNPLISGKRFDEYSV